MSKRIPPKYHEDVEYFRAALAFTEAETGFNARLIEKDYFCSLLLEGLQGPLSKGLVFKGGTSLSKIHCDFYRMSEDLDFTISVPVDSTRSVRSRAVKPVGKRIEMLAGGGSAFVLRGSLQGHNNSTQYTTEIAYHSVVTGQAGRIKLEISVREPVLETAANLPCRSLLCDPFRREPVLAPISVDTLSLRETYAEKLRAALTRREPAIRDFFDIDYAMRKRLLDINEEDFIKMVRCKLDIPGNQVVDISSQKAGILQRQLRAQLRPVLREKDFASFDLVSVFSAVAELAKRL